MNQTTLGKDWTGKIALAPLSAIFSGVGGDTGVHRHLAHKIIIGARALGLSKLRSGNGAVAIPAGALHRVIASDRSVVMVYLDARRFSWPAVQRLAARWRRFQPGGSIEPLLEELIEAPWRSVDERALLAIEALAQGQLRGQVSQELGLSESRLTHLVTETLGAPPRAWRTWIRLREAVDLVGEGRTVTEAAHAAGFADAAHLSRTCSASLGIPPVVLRRSSIEIAGAGRCSFR